MVVVMSSSVVVFLMINGSGFLWWEVLFCWIGLLLIFNEIMVVVFGVGFVGEVLLVIVFVVERIFLFVGMVVEVGKIVFFVVVGGGVIFVGIKFFFCVIELRYFVFKLLILIFLSLGSVFVDFSRFLICLVMMEVDWCWSLGDLVIMKVINFFNDLGMLSLVSDLSGVVVWCFISLIMLFVLKGGCFESILKNRYFIV